MRLDQFEFRGLTLEIKFEPNYLIWDRTGAIWETIRLKWPELSMNSASPTTQNLNIGRRFNIVLELNKIHFTQFSPDAELAEFGKLGVDLLETLKKEIGLSVCTRLGLRSVYFKTYEDKDDATKDFLALNLVKRIQGKHFNIEGVMSLPEYHASWEDEDLGARIIMGAYSQTVNFDPPLTVWEVSKQTFSRTGVQIDVDYYTRKSVPVGNLAIKDWIEQSKRAVRRSIRDLIES